MEIEQEIFLGDVKREPSVEYEFALSPAPEDEPASDDGATAHVDADVSPKRQRSQKLASSSKVFKCNECSYQTKHKGHLMNHKGTHNKSFECETCQKKFATNTDLKNHQMQHKHGIYATADETFDCVKCDKWFSTSKLLKKHQASVHDDVEVQCNVCDKVFKNRRSLRSHSRTHVKVECSICRKIFQKASMGNHRRTHMAANLFECDICGSSYKRKAHLKEHIERVHLLRKLVRDSECFKDFDDFELLEKLQRKHGSSAKTSEKKFKCDICSRSYVTPNSLNYHKRKVHADKTFQCEICKKAFKTKDDLNQHKANVHSKVCCSVCRKKIGQRQLKSHMKFHQPGYHFECDLCGFKTKWKRNVSRHINSKHRSSLKRSPRCGKVLANAKLAPSSSLPDGLSVNNPDSVALPRSSNGTFMLSFVDRIENLPPYLQRQFQRDLKAFVDDFINQNAE